MSEKLARIAALDDDDALTVADLISAFGALRSQNARAIGVLSSAHRISPTDLRAVSFAAANGGVTPKQAAEHLGLTTGSLTSLIDRLETAKLVNRRANPNDRRSLIVRVTPQGAAMMAEVNAIYQRAFEAAFDDDELRRMREAFLTLAAALGEIADSRGSHSAAAFD